MAAISVRNSLKQTVQYGVQTGLIFRTKNGAGLLVDSNEQVLVADLSTSVLGHAAAPAVNAALAQPYATNSRQDNTGV